jgi:hypothetical protein
VWVSAVFLWVSFQNKGEGEIFMRRDGVAFFSTHSFPRFSHNLKSLNNALEVGFSFLSTEKLSSYYYYLYIDKTRSVANPQTMKDFQITNTGRSL